MSDTPQSALPSDEKIVSAFRETLDQHGYGFHYAVMNEVADVVGLIRQSDIDRSFRIEAVELPVSTGKHDTRIDFVIKHETWPLYLSAECKRVNPKYSTWCFARAPRGAGAPPSEKLVVERIRCVYSKQASTSVRAYGMACGSIDERAYRIAIPVKEPFVPKDALKGSDAIEDAAFQAIKGMNGLVEAIRTLQPKALEQLAQGTHSFAEVSFVLPVIFTTARLFTTDDDIADADVFGIGAGGPTFQSKEVSWLYYQYPVSPSSRTSGAVIKWPAISSKFEAEYLRTIAIVSARGIKDFFWGFDPEMVRDAANSFGKR